MDAISAEQSAATMQMNPAIAKASIRPGPAFCAPDAVSTKMPVPITAPIPNSVYWNAPSVRVSDFFFAVAKMASSGLTRPKIMRVPYAPAAEFAAFFAPEPSR